MEHLRNRVTVYLYLNPITHQETEQIKLSLSNPTTGRDDIGASILMCLLNLLYNTCQLFATCLCVCVFPHQLKITNVIPPYQIDAPMYFNHYQTVPLPCMLSKLLESNTPFTQGLRLLCLPCATTKLARSPLKAEGRPNGCLGRSRVAHRTFRHRHGRHGRREVLSMFKTVAQRSPRRSVIHRSLKGGRMKAHTSPRSQNKCTVVGHWSPSKKCEHCVSIWATRLPPLYHHCASFGRPMASIERLLWRPLCLHSATTATLEPPWQWFCLHSAFFARPVVPLQQFWSFKEGTRVVLQQLHRNRTFWVPATTERPSHFYGRTKVARRSQPCVKGD